MLITKVHRRYAKALLDFAKESNMLDEVYKDVLLVREYLDVSSELRNVLKSPVIISGKKAEVISSLFEQKVSSSTLKFMLLIIKHGREAGISDTMASFIEQYMANKGIEQAVIESAVPLSKDQIESLRSKLGSFINSSIEIVEKVNPDLIGGMKIMVGGRQFDGSVKSQLRKLRRSFNKNTFVPNY